MKPICQELFELSRHIKVLTDGWTDRQTDRQMDGQTDQVITILYSIQGPNNRDTGTGSCLMQYNSIA